MYLSKMRDHSLGLPTEEQKKGKKGLKNCNYWPSMEIIIIYINYKLHHIKGANMKKTVKV